MKEQPAEAEGVRKNYVRNKEKETTFAVSGCGAAADGLRAYGL